ncbi:MAG: pitrilysin family protein [Alphaproteobacteria bacterium]|nr:pitrilysin family protein [Alphaproteobacteria bacterium]
MSAGSAGIKTTTLDNGLRVISYTMPHMASVNIGIWVGTGSRAEEKSNNGVAHFLEHMAFKGTKTRTARELALLVEDVGGYINAYTSRENTAYYLKILRNDLPMAVDVLADILINPLFPEDEIEKERGVIQQEIGQSLDLPDDQVYDFFQEIAYPDQPMGRPILGTSDTVHAMSRTALVDFMAEGYQTENMVLAAAGALDHEQLIELAAHSFRALKKGNAPQSSKAIYAGGEKTENRDSEQVHFKLGFEGVSLHNDEKYASKVLSMLLGGGSSSRLFDEIREKRGLVYSVYSYSDFFQDSGLFGIYAGTGEKEIAELVPVLCDCLNATRNDLNEDELQRAKAQLKSTLLMGMESNDALANHLGASMLSFNHFWTMEELSRKIDEVSLLDVQKIAEKHFSGKPTLAAIGPLSHFEGYDRLASRL